MIIFVIIFAILVILVIALSTWYIYLRNQIIECQVNPHIWCYNDWTCNNPTGPCPAGTNVCYTNNGTIDSKGNTVSPPGLVNCLIGPQTEAATFCAAAITPPGEVEVGDPACECLITTDKNCFNNCNYDITKVPPTTPCAIKTT
jgi:hypothetical protein